MVRSGRRATGIYFSLIAMIAAFLAATSTNPASASNPTTRNVPSSQYTTIQAAINAAKNGDTVLVASGTYTGSGNVDLDLQGKAITVKSADGAGQTIINCAATANNWHRGFNIHCGESSSSLIEGFTIENGRADFGGGISLSNASATIAQCAFVNDNALVGGAINVYDGASVIAQNVFQGNSAGQSDIPGVGGAVAVEQDCSTNSASSVYDCVFDSNTASVDGAAVFIAGTKLILSGGPCGKGIVASANVVNCSFSLNSISSSYHLCSGDPGTIAFYGGEATITNTILYGDTSKKEISTEFPCGSSLTVEYSDVEGGVSGVGNMAANPDYVNAADGDLELSNSSPCIGAGIADASTPLVDILGNPFGPYPAMGAYAHALVATHLVISGPSTASAGTPITITVTAEDQYGHTVTSYPGTVAITSSDDDASLPHSSGLTDGTGTFPVTLNSGGTQTVTATDTGNSSITGSKTVTVSLPSPTVATPAAGNPNPVTGTSISLSALGAYTGPGGASALTYTWSATGPATVTYSSNGNNSAKTSTATFTKAGTYVFTVTISNGEGGTVTSTVTVTVNQTLTSIVVSSSASGPLNLGGSRTFTAKAYDQFGNLLATQPTFAWSVNAGGVGSVNASSGAYSAGSTPGSATVRATSGSVSGTASVSVVDPGPSVVNPAGANPNPVTGTSVSLSALGSDLAGASALSYTWSATGPAGVTYSDNGDNTAQNTTATFTAAGTYVFTVTIANPYGGTTTSQVTVTVNQTLTSISVSPSPVTLNIGGGDTFTAIAYDQFGNAMGTQPTVAWSVDAGGIGSINAATGIYATGLTPGTATVRGTSGSVSGTASVTVVDPAPSVVNPAAANPNPVTGTTASLSALGSDLAGASGLTYTWSATGPAAVTYSDNGDNTAQNTTATFTAAGTYVFTVTIANPYGGTVTSQVTVTVNQTLTSIVVSPTSGPLNVGSTNAFTAKAYDQFGALLASQPAIAWSIDAGGVGSVNPSSGLYSAGLVPGSATVRATSGSISGTASVSVVDPGPSVISPAGANPNPVTGTTVSLSALGSDLAGASLLSYTWSATGPAGVTYSDNGDNTAQNTTATFTAAGTYVFTVTIANPYGGTTTSQVTVTVNQTLTSIVVSPNPDSINLGGGDTFTAIAYDQFGTALGTQPTFSWSVDAGGVGSIDPATGIYTAGFTPGTATVRGTSGSVSGTSSVTITDPGPSVASPAAANPNPVVGATASLSALGSDLAGASGLTYTWSATGPAAVTYSDNGDNTAQNTTATFTVAGSYVFTVTITNPSGGTVTSTVDVTVSQTVASITVTPGPSITFQSPAVQQFTATAYDQFGNIMNPQPAISWTLCNPAVLPINPPLCSSAIGSINIGTGLYHSGPAPGTATVVAYVGSVIATCSVTVTTAVPTVATPAAAAPAIVNGNATHLSVLGAYAGIGGGTVLTYTWAETSGPSGVTFSANGTTPARSTVATFTQAGNYVFTVTIANAYGQSVTSSVNVTVNQTLTSVTVTPGPTLTVTLVTSQQFTATGNDQFGNPMSTQPTFSWSIGATDDGSVSSTTGLYHTGFAPGTATVTAASGGIMSSCLVTVIAPPVIITTAANATPSTVTGTTTNLNVLAGYGGPGGEAILTYTWAVTSGPSGVTFSANGTNAANNTTATFTQVGTYTFTATITNPFGGTTTSSVTVTVASTVSSITVSPGPTLTLGPPLPQTQQFSATAYDQFNNLMSPQPAIIWEVETGGVGSIGDTSGFYHSGTVPGTTTIKAKVGTVFGTTVVTVN